MHAHKTNAILRAIGPWLGSGAHRPGLRQSVVVRMQLSCHVIIVINNDSVLVRVRILQYPTSWSFQGLAVMFGFSECRAQPRMPQRVRYCATGHHFRFNREVRACDLSHSTMFVNVRQVPLKKAYTSFYLS
jgi:hypothetical protein